MAKTACKKCDPHEICEECPEWIFTLADLIMCMMGLFVILWVLKPGIKEQTPESNAELVKVLAAIRSEFDYVPDPLSNDPVDIEMLAKKIESLKSMKSPGDGGKTTLKRQGADGTDPEVTTIRPGNQATEGGKLVFERNDATLTDETKRQLDQIANLI